MPIEFRCAACGRLLRVPDGTTNRPSKCPACGHVQPIPAPGGPGSDPTALRLPSAGPLPEGGAPRGAAPPVFPAWQPPEVSTDAEPDNPFAAPRFAGAASLLEGGDTADRDGPAWERDGAGVGSFVATAADCLFNPSQGFGRMRPDGGYFLPLAFAVIATTCGVLVQLAMIGLVALVGASNEENFPQAANEIGLMVLVFTFIAGFYLLAGVGAMVVATFFIAAINKLLLNLMHGSDASFEAVYRVTTYALGAAAAICVVPCVGLLAAGVAQHVVLILGLMYGLRIGGGKAALIGMAPTLCCCFPPVAMGVVAGMLSN